MINGVHLEKDWKYPETAMNSAQSCDVQLKEIT